MTRDHVLAGHVEEILSAARSRPLRAVAVRAMHQTDLDGLRKLYSSIYDESGTIDQMFDSAFGPIDWIASSVIEGESYELVAAGIVVEKPSSPLVPSGRLLLELMVDKTRRREGLATALLQHIAAKLAEEGVDVLALRVAGDNEAATSLYGSMGFRRLM